MISLFDAYAAIAGSGLFDARFYVTTYPDVETTHSDPLVHYIECGAAEGRSPNPDFDVGYYYAQCAESGERPENPLLHFLFIGSDRGYHLQPEQVAKPEPVTKPKPVAKPEPVVGPVPAAAVETVETPDNTAPDKWKMCIDSPRLVDGRAVVPVTGSLTVRGWALVRGGVAGIDVAVDGVKVTSAFYGSKRVDVARSYADWPDRLNCGFSAIVPASALSPGDHVISLDLRTKDGHSASAEFGIEALADVTTDGPAVLREKMPAIEAIILGRRLAEMRHRALFWLFVLLAGQDNVAERLRTTLTMVRNQEYDAWRLVIVCPNPPEGRSGITDVMDEFRDVADRLSIVTEIAGRAFASFLASGALSGLGIAWIGVLQAGDHIGCDALLRLALAAALQPTADVLYSDERKQSMPSVPEQAFFKPGWSPDLMFSGNYLGRFWCASAALWKTAGIHLEDAFKFGEYDLALRCTEMARRIVHVPHVLGRRGADHIDDESTQREALQRALSRRGISGNVVPGMVSGTFRVQRHLAKEPLVSIIIATRAERGLIRTCIDTIKAQTAYSNYEIVCIENIPAAQTEDKAWLAKHADVVIPGDEVFNWSRFNNRAVREAQGELLLFLNDDIEILEADWLSCLAAEALRPEVGAVGALLLYPDGRIQHAGVALAGIGRARHIFRYEDDPEGGYFGLALTQRNVSAVTGACLMTRRDVFITIGGFDEAHTIVNNDVDYCLRAQEAGLLTVYTPYVRLIHHETASRADLGDLYDENAFADRWATLHAHGDPFSHRHLIRDSDDVAPEAEPVEEVYCGPPLLRRAVVRHILIVKLDHIGDSVTALPAIRRLRRLFPAARLTLLAAPWARGLWAGEAAIDEVIEFAAFHERSEEGPREVSDDELAALAKRLAAGRFDLAIDLRKSPETRPILRLSGARWLAGYDRDGEFPWLDVALEWEFDHGMRRKRTHVTDDLLALVEAVATASSEDDSRSGVRPAQPAATASALTVILTPDVAEPLFARPVVCVHPAAGNPLRQWPVTHFSTLIDLLIARHGVHVALLGTAADVPMIDQVLSGVRRREAVWSLAGQVSLDDLPMVLRGAVLFVGNNSGPQHLAASLGVPTVAIHGGVVDAREWGPRGPRAQALRRMMACSPCYLERADDCPRQLTCLTGLQPAAVFDRCSMWLGGG